jgi:hypothetical protein
MNRNYILLLIIFLPGMMNAQLTESFTDGDFTTSPAWNGDAQLFKVNSSYQLQLNSSGENSSSLATAVSVSDSMEWNFWVKQSFSPSGNNFSKVYLMADQQDLKGPLNGYFIKLGESGSDDAIELFRQSGDIETSLCKGSPGLIASSFAIRIKVTRSPEGFWKILADKSGGVDYSSQATASDNTYTTSSWFGVSCKYTSSNSTKFYFDDFYVGPVIVDNTRPELLSASILTSNSLKLQFSEIVDSASAANPTNYSVNHEIGNPVQAERDAGNPSIVILAFSQAFIADIPYTLTASGIKDLAGNSIAQIPFPFGWHAAQSFDVLINEVMCDPDPPVTLPNYEYIELFNRSTIPADMSGWSITIGTSTKSLPTFQLEGGGFVILCDDDAQPFLEPYGPVISFASFSLVNTGTTITLRDQQGGIIHSVSYSDYWYRSDYKKNGGWSLELIDPANPCGESGNWIASINPYGGTPGKVNSVKTQNPDIQLPRIQRVGITDPMHITVTFSESLDSSALADRANYLIDNGIGRPVSVIAVSPGYRQVNLLLASSIEAGNTYTLTLSGSITDCAGNLLPINSTAHFALAETANQSDLVINEVLFNPKEGCVDFLEIYNRSMKVLDLREFTLATYDTLGEVLSDVSNISKESFLALPGDYYALTADTSKLWLCQQSNMQGSVVSSDQMNPSGYLLMDKIPPMNNDAGSIALALRDGKIIDNVIYTSDMQYPLLVSSEGVSLERINPERPASDRSNWHSAAGSAGYATPALKNSQYCTIAKDENEISISPGIFSPDNDGHDDVLSIAYTFSTSGYNSTVTVFDGSGHLIRNLVTNELCGTSGTWSWDGINNRNEKALIGRYVVFVEVFDLQGNVKKYKRTAVLGGYL